MHLELFPWLELPNYVLNGMIYVGLPRFLYCCYGSAFCECKIVIFRVTVRLLECWGWQRFLTAGILFFEII